MPVLSRWSPGASLSLIVHHQATLLATQVPGFSSIEQRDDVPVMMKRLMDQDELINLALDFALADCIPEIEPEMPWQDQLITYFRQFWWVMTTEPGLGAVAISRPLQGPNMGRITNDLMQICVRAGVGDHAIAIIDGLLLMTLGAVAYDISRPATARKDIATDESTPELARCQDAYGQRNPSEYFMAAMETVMVGLETRMARGDLPSR